MIFDNWREKSDAQLSEALLWDYNLDSFDWEAMKEVVVQRVIERGWPSDFYFAINKYGGLEAFKNIIRQIGYLDDYDIVFVREAFNLNENELCSYRNKQLREAR